MSDEEKGENEEPEAKGIDASSFTEMKAASAATSEDAVAAWLGISPPKDDDKSESKDGS